MVGCFQQICPADRRKGYARMVFVLLARWTDECHVVQTIYQLTSRRRHHLLLKSKQIGHIFFLFNSGSVHAT